MLLRSGTIRDLRRKREKLGKKVKELVEERVGVDKKDNSENPFHIPACLCQQYEN
jgi:hypothetical protein